MEVRRFMVTVKVFIDATDSDEAAMIIERHLAGAFDSELVTVGVANDPEA
ncbi:MAG: hypothetical protein M3360_10070 [Actinomycetota bacterium]|nr:hypothetical protein [Actinomycetota bacterium]